MRVLYIKGASVRFLAWSKCGKYLAAMGVNKQIEVFRVVD